MTAIGLLVSGSTGDALVCPPALYGVGAPTKPGILGQSFFDTSTSPRTAYTWSGTEWLFDAGSSSEVFSVTGTANQISASPTTGNVVLSLIGPYTLDTYTAHGVLIGEGTSSIAATTAGTTGQLLHSSGAAADPTWTTTTYPLTAVAGDLIAATATNVIGQIADVAVGQVLASGGVGVIPAYTATPSVSSMTLTAGNLTVSQAASGLILTPTIASGATPQTANGRVGQVTFTGVSIASGASSAFVISNTAITGAGTVILYSMTGATAGSALTIESVVNAASSSTITVTNGTSATMVTSVADITFTFLVLN